MFMSGKRWRYLQFGMIACLAAALLYSCGDGEKGKKGAGSGEEMKREIGEAYEATKGYLQEKKSEMGSEFDRRLNILENDIELLRERAAAAGETGREKTDEALAVLSRKQEEVRVKLDEFRASGGDMMEDAARRLEEALEELDEAYRKARERYGSSKE